MGAPFLTNPTTATSVMKKIKNTHEPYPCNKCDEENKGVISPSSGFQMSGVPMIKQMTQPDNLVEEIQIM